MVDLNLRTPFHQKTRKLRYSASGQTFSLDFAFDQVPLQTTLLGLMAETLQCCQFEVGYWKVVLQCLKRRDGTHPDRQQIVDQKGIGLDERVEIVAGWEVGECETDSTAAV